MTWKGGIITIMSKQITPFEEEENMICPKCQSEVTDGSAFCTKCGAALGGNNQQNYSQPEGAAPQGDNQNRVILIRSSMRRGTHSLTRREIHSLIIRDISRIMPVTECRLTVLRM